MIDVFAAQCLINGTTFSASLNPTSNLAVSKKTADWFPRQWWTLLECFRSVDDVAFFLLRHVFGEVGHTSFLFLKTTWITKLLGCTNSFKTISTEVIDPHNCCFTSQLQYPNWGSPWCWINGGSQEAGARVSWIEQDVPDQMPLRCAFTVLIWGQEINGNPWK